MTWFYGGFGVYEDAEPVKIVWTYFSESRKKLGDKLTDRILEIIAGHDHIQFEKEDYTKMGSFKPNWIRYTERELPNVKYWLKRCPFRCHRKINPPKSPEKRVFCHFQPDPLPPQRIPRRQRQGFFQVWDNFGYMFLSLWHYLINWFNHSGFSTKLLDHCSRKG